jgi:monofunctional biosynthetic peptidoglycan transglycosylase
MLRAFVSTVVAALIVLLIPYLLVPVYRVINPVSTLMLWRWATGARVQRVFVPLERMAPALPITVIAAEDGRFCQHRGVDWREIRERLEEVDDISQARGVSTITQQTAKNLFLWPVRSLVRKALEFPLALWIDLVLPKWRVLEIYLNVAEWGPNGQFGAETASRHAFNKPASSLNPREAALLAAVLPNPRRRSARVPGSAVRRLAAIYESRGANQASLAHCMRHARSRTSGVKGPLPLYPAPARPGTRDNPETNHGCSQAKSLAIEARDAPLRRCAREAHLYRGQGFR